jgi:hypothetical protein
MADRWQRRRTDFNHDWLKNRYVQALGRWLRVLDDQVDDPIMEQSFVRRVLPEWEVRAANALALARSYESEMSPSSLFGLPPLSGCRDSTRAWLRPLVHELWASKYRVRGTIECAVAALEQAQESYDGIQAELEAVGTAATLQSLRGMRPLFQEFRDRCQRVGEAFSMFLSEVRTT